jgi:hypothetical protein
MEERMAQLQAEQKPPVMESITERLSQWKAEEKLAGRQEAQAQEQRKNAMQRLQERFDEQLKQHYEPADKAKPDVWQAISDQSATLTSKHKSPLSPPQQPMKQEDPKQEQHSDFLADWQHNVKQYRKNHPHHERERRLSFPHFCGGVKA